MEHCCRYASSCDENIPLRGRWKSRTTRCWSGWSCCVGFQSWSWMKHGKVTGLAKPLTLMLNPTISISVIDAANITVRVRGVNKVCSGGGGGGGAVLLLLLAGFTPVGMCDLLRLCCHLPPQDFSVGNKGLKGSIQDTVAPVRMDQRNSVELVVAVLTVCFPVCDCLCVQPNKRRRPKKKKELGVPESDAATEVSSTQHPTLIERFEQADHNVSNMCLLRRALVHCGCSHLLVLAMLRWVAVSCTAFRCLAPSA
mgnify:CR=1 FL=1